MKIGIVIINYFGDSDTLSCLDSLRKLTTSEHSLITVVVNNGSSHNFHEKISAQFSDVIVINPNKNTGFAGGNNLGITHLMKEQVDFLWLINNDTQLHIDSLNELLRFAQEHSKAIIGPKIYFSPGKETHKLRYKLEELGNVIWYAGGVIDWNNVLASHRGVDEVDHGQFNVNMQTMFVTGCSMFFPASLISEVGMFDEKLYLYYEDVDLCLRAQQHGYELWYDPKAILWHNNAGSSGGTGSQLHEYYLTRNRLIIGMRYAPFRTKIALVRQLLSQLYSGSAMQKKAIVDFLLHHYGKAE